MNLYRSLFSMNIRCRKINRERKPEIVHNKYDDDQKLWDIMRRWQERYPRDQVPNSPAGEKQRWPVKVVRAGVGGSGFLWVFKDVCREEKTVRRAEGWLWQDFSFLLVDCKRKGPAGQRRIPISNKNCQVIKRTQKTPATVVRQKKWCSCMAGNAKMLKKAMFRICFIYRLL